MIGKEETKQKKLKKCENLTSLSDKKNQHTKKVFNSEQNVSYPFLILF